MKISISHARNPLLGWDIDVSVQAEDAQKIGQVTVRINDVTEAQDQPGEALIPGSRRSPRRESIPAATRSK